MRKPLLMTALASALAGEAAASCGSAFYSFVQLPLYQYVNGVQLTADWAFVAGASVRF
jgi:hypothetical protein